MPAPRNQPDPFLVECREGAMFDLYSPLAIYRTRGSGTDVEEE
jgi:hypothetical protein